MASESIDLKKERAARVTENQKQALIEFLRDNPNFATRKFSNKFTAITYESLWERLKVILNGLGPPKNVKAWKKYVNDSKGYAKRKAAEKKKSYIKTGGGTDDDLPELNEFEENIIDVSGGTVWVEGDNISSELGFDLNSSSETTGSLVPIKHFSSTSNLVSFPLKVKSNTPALSTSFLTRSDFQIHSPENIPASSNSPNTTLDFQLPSQSITQVQSDSFNDISVDVTSRFEGSDKISFSDYMVEEIEEDNAEKKDDPPKKIGKKKMNKKNLEQQNERLHETKNEPLEELRKQTTLLADIATSLRRIAEAQEKRNEILSKNQYS